MRVSTCSAPTRIYLNDRRVLLQVARCVGSIKWVSLLTQGSASSLQTSEQLLSAFKVKILDSIAADAHLMPNLIFVCADPSYTYSLHLIMYTRGDRVTLADGISSCVLDAWARSRQSKLPILASQCFRLNISLQVELR